MTLIILEAFIIWLEAKASIDKNGQVRPHLQI